MTLFRHINSPIKTKYSRCHCIILFAPTFALFIATKMNILARLQNIPKFLMGPKPLACGFSTTPRLLEPPSLVKMRHLQQHYQCDDGTPVWLKRGMPDRILYTSTLVGCGLGLFFVVLLLYDHAKPESWKGK